MRDRLTASLQESVLTLLCTNDAEGAIAAGLVDTDLFEPPYDDIARRALDFRTKFGQAPGNAHLDDIFDHVLSDSDNKQHRLYTQILQGILEQGPQLNAPYVLSRTTEFLQAQSLKAAVLEAAQRYQQDDDNLVPDVQRILHEALKFRVETLDAGTFLTDHRRALRYLDMPAGYSYGLGIPELDRRGIGPTRGKALAFMAPAGAGKTWFCIDAAVKGMLQGARVAHVSLEMGEEELSQRYHQRMFAIAKRNEKFDTTSMELDELGRIKGFTKHTAKPGLHYQDPKIATKITQRMNDFGTRFGKLVIKRFPTSYLTLSGLESWLDALELTCKFVPDILIVDYPRLMDLDKRQDRRVAIGMIHEQLRGMCIKRNIAGIFPVQSNRDGETVKLLTRHTIGEDYSIVQTMDMLLTYNQTKAEHKAGLARVYVDKARGDEDKFQVLISQAYHTGQFVLQSHFMPGDYFDRVKALVGTNDNASTGAA